MVSNGVADEKTILQNRKQAVLSSLCKYLSLDNKSLSLESVGGDDLKSLFTNILKASGKEASIESNEVSNWVAFADTFPIDSNGSNEALKKLNEDLAPKSVLVGGGLKISEVDILVFSTLHSFVSGLSATDRKKYPNVLRWMDYVQNKEDLSQLFATIPLEKMEFKPHVSKVEPETSSKKAAQGPKTDDKLKVDLNPKKSDKVEVVSNSEKIEKVEPDSPKKSSTKKKGGDAKAPEKETIEKDIELSVSLLNIQVGLIRKAWKHPSADSLLVEEIDLGDGNTRQVVSGLAKFCSPDDLTNRRVALITNVKPGKLRDVASSGLVLCASNADHTVVEPLLPPEGAKIGERVSFSGHDGKPEDVLNPKKKQLEKITPYLVTDDKGVATFKGVPFMTTGGPCTSSIPNASIK